MKDYQEKYYREMQDNLRLEAKCDWWKGFAILWMIFSIALLLAIVGMVFVSG